MAAGPKRLLAIDGSLSRVGLSLGFLRKIEEILRERTGHDDLLLSDYFDLIGGTGAGAVLAAALATGNSVGETERFSAELSRTALSSRSAVSSLFSLFSGSRWGGAALQRLFPGQRFHETEWRTGVCLLTLDVQAGTIFALHNHPAGQFAGLAARDWQLRDCLEACITAPPYRLMTLPLEEKRVSVFTDAELGMAGGAAWPLFVVSTSKIHPFGWTLGVDDLLLVSIGCGSWRERAAPEAALNRSLLQWMNRLPSLCLHDAAQQSRLLFEAISRTPTPPLIEAEAEDDSSDQLLPTPALTHLRYDLELSETALPALDLPEFADELPRLRSPSSAADLDLLWRAGNRAADRLVEPGHFPEVFDHVRGTKESANRSRSKSRKKAK
jgi:hypothetical protein